ncbi:MAG: hypothetical protein NC928_05930 [Candidatus Omnitrophica bacterium]|nr:hypothetical protein [Candidatus Omnitrophota bacterium]
MGEKIKSKLGLAILMLAAFWVMPKYAFAAFTINVEPYRGGSELVFTVRPGTTAEPREVKIKINTDVNKRYEVKQVIVDVVDNGRGDRIPWRNFSLYGLRGTNTYGTFHVAADAPVGVVSSIDRLYTSAANGPAESGLILVYILNLPSETPAGTYRGRIKFILNSLEGGQNQAYDFLNFVVNVGTEPTPEVKPLIEIATATGAKTIRLNSKEEKRQSEDILVKINGSFKNQFTINQLVIKPLISNEGNQLDYKAINIQTQEVDKAEGISKQPLSERSLTIYKSDVNGQADNEFIITYSLGDLSQAKAGRYTSTIQYYYTELGKHTPLGTLELEVENERIFDLVITAQDQKGMIEFRDLKPRDLPKTSEVIIEVKSNIGKQYQVSQNVLSDLTDKEGNVIPAKYFKLRMEDIDTKGTLKFLQAEEVKKGDTVLFISDNKGSGDKFKLIYELTCPKDLKAGDYSTRITYSLLEI